MVQQLTETKTGSEFYEGLDLKTVIKESEQAAQALVVQQEKKVFHLEKILTISVQQNMLIH